MSRHDVVKRHDFRSAMKSVRFDGIYSGKEAEVGHGGVSIYIYIFIQLMLCIYLYIMDL